MSALLAAIAMLGRLPLTTSTCANSSLALRKLWALFIAYTMITPSASIIELDIVYEKKLGKQKI